MIEKRRVPLLLVVGTNVKRHPVDARRERPAGQIPTRPSASVSRVPCDTGSLPSSRHSVTATPDAGSPREVSRTCVEIVGRLVLGMLKIRVGSLTFTARLEEQNAPKTVAVIRKMLPLKSKIVHCRWSGESTWIPMGERKLGLDFENHTSHPSPGMLLLYPGGISETELLFPYGSTMFASKVGQLAGNHFATITQGQEQLPEIGRLTLWEGAQEIVIEEVR